MYVKMNDDTLNSIHKNTSNSLAAHCNQYKHYAKTVSLGSTSKRH